MSQTHSKKKKFILLTNDLCSACQELDKRTKGTLPKNIRKVELLSEEGMKIAERLGDDFEGIPTIVERKSGRMRVCEIMDDGETLTAVCSKGELILTA